MPGQMHRRTTYQRSRLDTSRCLHNVKLLEDRCKLGSTLLFFSCSSLHAPAKLASPLSHGQSLAARHVPNMQQVKVRAYAALIS